MTDGEGAPRDDRDGEDDDDHGHTDAASEPFEHMETDDRPDPFAELDEAPDTADAVDTTIAEGETGVAAERNEPAGTSGSDPDDPFARLDSSVGTDDEFDIDNPFERMEMDEVDADVMWDALDADIGTDASIPGRGVDPDPDTRREDVVDKRTYCQRCPHFAEPPATACTHDGTEIVEVLDFAEFRVRGCPMVTEDGPGFDRTR